MTPRAAGSWPSPITASDSVGIAVGVSEVIPDGDDVWWAETRPGENGRTAIVRWSEGLTTDVTPPDSNARTSVHEYGGGAWWADRGVVYYVEFGDQRLRRLEPGGEPVLLSPDPAQPRGLRYADGRVTPDGDWFVCVRERHGEGQPVNELVAVATDGSMRIETVASGADFYASPRVSPDGTRIVWIQWDHPDMPWDVTELWVADLDGATVSNPHRLVGNGAEALQQPEWYADGELRVVTDRDEWWNLYEVDLGDGTLRPLATGEFEVVEPHWVFGGSRHTPGAHVIGTPSGDRLSNAPDLPYTTIRSLRATGDGHVFVAGDYASANEVVRLRSGQVEVLRPGVDLGLDSAFFDPPEQISFPTSGREVAHALFYAPAHPDWSIPDDERPPVLVIVHGGPTSCAERQLQLARGHRFWTSRGLAVVDVDYRGSTRYGRSYRQRLRGNWCVIDVDDAVAAAEFLVGRGDVDGDRLLIEGGSAGGTLALLAISEHDVFAAATNLFGVTDLAALVTDDHKFESRYTDSLVGPWPDSADEYARRSPINHVDEITSPVLVIQGADDTVVPPSHSEAVVAAVRDRGLPVAYLLFEGEGHGFRRLESIVRWFEADLDFFGRVAGFEPHDDIDHIVIEHLDG